MTDGLEAARAAVMKAARSFGGPNRGVHGEISEVWVKGALDNYRDVIRADDRASESALRAAAQEAAALAENIAAHIDDLGGSGGDTVRTIASTLKAALSGAPWEPSEAMVERLGYWLATRDGEALSYEWGRDGTGPDGGVYRDYTTEARAALKAGMGIESGSAG